MAEICYTAIGMIRSPYQEPAGMPIQAVVEILIVVPLKI
jgi:hypothetical protein